MKNLHLKILSLGLLLITVNSQAGNISINLTAEKVDPVITWSQPWPIYYGDALGTYELNATSSVPGTFIYDPPAGTYLDAGNGQLLSVSFLPDDPDTYNSVVSSLTIDVYKDLAIATADNKTMYEGEMVPELTISYRSLTNGDGPEDIDSPPVCMTAASPSRSPGEYDIIMSGGSDINYEFWLEGGTVTILEHEAPVISDMPPEMNVFADQGFAHAIVLWTEPRARDNVGVTSFTSDHASGDAFPMGTTTVSYTATDAAGNQASASFTITVNKNNPVITWNKPETISYGTALGVSQLNASSAVAGTFSYNPPEGIILNANNMQTLSVSFVPDDPSASNSASASTTIDVAKTMLTATAENKSINQGEAVPELTLSYSGFVNGENHEALFVEPTLTTTATPESPAGDYVISVAGGSDQNYDFTLQPGTLTILDITNPVFSNIPTDIILFADDGATFTTVSWTPPTVTDNVGVTQNASNHSPGDTFPVGTTTVSYIAFDAAGNQSWASFTITVNKNIPVITWPTPEAIIYGTALGASQLTASSSATGTFSYDPPEGTLLDAGNTQTLNLSFSPDNPEAYNSVSASTTIDVNKVMLTASVENKSINEGDPIPELTFTYSGFVNSEDQGVIDTPPTLSTTATAESEAGDYVISITGGSDQNYELSLEPGTLTILDITPPLISNIPAEITVFADEGESYASVSWTPAIATDNVGVTSFSSDHLPGDTFTVGTTTVSYIASDEVGNQATASFTITVNKNIPVITWPTPEAIIYGTALGASQLTASSSATGTFSYDPPEGTLLDAGNTQTLNLSFSPDNPEAYNSVSASTTIDVNKVMLTASVENKSINEGDPIPELTFTYSGFVNSEDQGVIDTPPTLSTTATAESEAGDYVISITGGSDQNYELSLEPGTLTILDITHVDMQSQITCIVYPNPTNEGIRIKGVDGIATFTLYTMNGSALIKRKIEDKTYIPLTDIKPGTYLVSIQTPAGFYNTKIVKSGK